MHPTRRQFLLKAAGLAVCAQFPLHAKGQLRIAGSHPEPESDALDPLAGVTAETFAAWIGSSFQATLNRQPAGTLTLVSVTSFEPASSHAASRGVSAPPARENPTSFALRFSKTGSPLVQEVYTLEHHWLGTFPLLLVPSGLHQSPVTCTAVFTLLNRPA